MAMPRLTRLFCMCALPIGTGICAHAQLDDAPPTAPGEFTVAASEQGLTVQRVQERMRTVQTSPALEEDAKNRTVELLEQAAEALKRAESLEARAREFERAIQQAPATLAGIRKELSASPAPVPPDLPEDADVVELEAALQRAEAELAAARETMAELEAEAQRRVERRAVLPDILAAAEERLVETAAPPASTGERGEEPDVLSEARRWLRWAERREAQATRRAAELEMRRIEACRELLAARRDRAARQLVAAETLAKAWRREVQGIRRRESARLAERTRAARLATARLHPRIREIAERNQALADRRTGAEGLLQRLGSSVQKLQEVRSQIAAVQQQAEELEQQIDVAGSTHAVALLLRRQRQALPSIRDLSAAIKSSKKQVARVQIRLIELDDERAELFDVRALATEMAARISTSDAQQADYAAVIEQLLRTQRELLDTLSAEYGTYFSRLVDLDSARRQLLREAKDLSQSIAEHILWVRSDTPFGADTPGRLVEAWHWLRTQAGTADDAMRGLWRDIRRAPFVYLLFAALEVLLVARWRRVTPRFEHIAAQLVRIRTDRLAYTLETLARTVLAGVRLGLPFAFVAWRLQANQGVPFARASATGFAAVAVAAFVLSSAHAAGARSGLAESHFGWDRDELDRLRRLLVRFGVVLLPALWAVAASEWYHDQTGASVLGRVSFLVASGACALFAYAVLRRKRDTDGASRLSSPTAARFRMPALVACLGVPIAGGVGSAFGYHYTAVRIAAWFVQSVALVAAILLVQAVLVRGLRLVARRSELNRRVRAWREAREQAEHSAENGDQTTVGLGDSLPEPEELGTDVVALSEQTVVLIRTGVVLALVFGLWAIWAEAVPALGVLRNVVLWSGASPGLGGGGSGGVLPGALTLADLLVALVVLVVTVIGARNLPALVELVLLRRLPLGRGERYALTTFFRYVITAVGVVAGFAALGVGWSKIQWLVAALSVGLGFGLQEIFANFVSGLILLFERPIRVGDYVTVGDTSGQVTRIQSRATTITNWDRKELVIPNKRFVTGELINWTLSDDVLRVVVPVGVAYGTDTRLAEEVLLNVASENRTVLDDPAPAALFMGFGDSSLQFELRIFIASAEHFLTVKSDLHRAVDDAFREAGIVIAFPQRDIHIRTGGPPSQTVAPEPHA